MLLTEGAEEIAQRTQSKQGDDDEESDSDRR